MPPNTPTGPCAKRTYASLSVARKLARRVNDSGRERVAPYHCCKCHGWHLGTGWKRMQKSPRVAGSGEG